jgi:hypothetical protein
LLSKTILYKTVDFAKLEIKVVKVWLLSRACELKPITIYRTEAEQK